MSAWSYILIAIYPVALVCAARAILRSRTPQGATAWTVALLSFPFVVVPLYVVFGRSKFNGYRIKRRLLDHRAREELARIEKIVSEEVPAPEGLAELAAAVMPSQQIGFTADNKVSLLVNAQSAYPSMLEEIERAKDYIFFQFYIFRCDATGRSFVDALVRKARAGVEVCFLYDEIGSKISKSFLRRMQDAGVRVGRFNTTKGPKNRFQVNFRNHRKILIVDGKVAFTGGLNIGDEYRGLDPKIGPWRDTHIRVEGSAVMAIQTSFAKDWYWSQGEMIQGRWKAHSPEGGNATVLALHTGPVDDFRTCLLAHVALINAAQTRLWIATPYLVLPDSLSDALSLAALRGVDVRLLVPSRSDNVLVEFASRVYEQELLTYGVRIFRYDGGFLHQKVMLIDSSLGVVGSVNLDYRSMFLNFELSVMCTDSIFVHEMGQMLGEDFSRSTELFAEHFKKVSFARRLLQRTADLFAPIL